MRRFCLPKHPLGVRPGGNALLSSDYDNEVRSKQLGLFDLLPDEIILEILGFVKEPLDLMRLGHTSRMMYAFTWTNELWRNLYSIVEDIASDQPASRKWRGSWRRTLLNIPDETEEALLQCSKGSLCSDTLYRPFHCSMVDVNEIFKDIVTAEEQHATTFGRIERIDENKLSQAEFDSEWNRVPFILTSTNKDRWPTWDMQTLLERFPEEKFRQGSMKWSLSIYHEYVQKNQDESPLYLFDCDSQAMKILRQEYELPKIFQRDFFSVFEENGMSCRPDNAWLIAGPERSGSIFHKDPNATSAWNTVLSGKKLWIMLPPDVSPPGVGFDVEESEVSSPVSLAELVLSGYFSDAKKLVSQGKCFIGVTFPGECLYVPSGWWHSVINLEHSVALTQNFVPEGKLHQTLFFLKHKPDQLSGFHSNDVRNSISTFLKHNKDSNSNTIRLTSYLEQSENIDDNEDCGVMMAELGTRLPIYEFLHELLTHSGYKDQLEEAKMGLRLIEKSKENAIKVRDSALWNALTDNQNETGKTFSFGFDGSEEE